MIIIALLLLGILALELWYDQCRENLRDWALFFMQAPWHIALWICIYLNLYTWDEYDYMYAEETENAARLNDDSEHSDDNCAPLG